MMQFLSRMQQNRKVGKWGRAFPLLTMSVPFFLLLVLFAYVPLWGWYLAFTSYYPGDSLLYAEFVGFRNFEHLFMGSQFVTAMRNTLVLSALGLLLSPLPMLFAILLNEIKRIRFAKIIQIVSSFPNFISWVIIYAIFFAFFSLDDGLVNRLLFRLGLIGQPTDILTNRDIAWWLQAAISMWKGLGWSAIIYIASIASLDPEMYQAAEVDGAGRFRQIRYITIPGLMPTYAVIFLLGIGYILSSGFEQYYVFDNSVVHTKLDVLDTYVYNVGLVQLNFPFSTAAGIFKSLVSVVLVFTANGLYKKATGRGIV